VGITNNSRAPRTNLFSYFEHFHPFLPLLDPLRSPDDYYETCPLLFWMILAIASRRFGDDPTLLSSLAKFVPKLTWECISDTPLTYTIVQTLLIFCMWPFPDTHMWSDASTTFSNVALNAAFHMGLHRPDHAQEFTRNPRAKKPFFLASHDPLERRKTWAATNIVSQ
jgi:Fungal specific transcription factor domain